MSVYEHRKFDWDWEDAEELPDSKNARNPFYDEVYEAVVAPMKLWDVRKIALQDAEMKDALLLIRALHGRAKAAETSLRFRRLKDDETGKMCLYVCRSE